MTPVSGRPLSLAGHVNNSPAPRRRASTPVLHGANKHHRIQKTINSLKQSFTILSPGHGIPARVTQPTAQSNRPGAETSSSSVRLIRRRYTEARSHQTDETRSCDSCRRQKEKCEGDAPCRRCARLGHRCEFTSRASRRAAVAGAARPRHEVGDAPLQEPTSASVAHRYLFARALSSILSLMLTVVTQGLAHLSGAESD